MAGEAGDAWERLGCPFEAAMAWADSTDRADLRLATARFQELGAAAGVTLVRRRMRTLGIPVGSASPRARTREHRFGLTDREQEILALLAEGLSDREIADRLVLSVRTVGHHVSNILSKLGVDSRREAARRFAAEASATASA